MGVITWLVAAGRASSWGAEGRSSFFQLGSNNRRKKEAGVWGGSLTGVSKSGQPETLCLGAPPFLPFCSPTPSVPAVAPGARPRPRRPLSFSSTSGKTRGRALGPRADHPTSARPLRRLGGSLCPPEGWAAAHFRRFENPSLPKLISPRKGAVRVAYSPTALRNPQFVREAP